MNIKNYTSETPVGRSVDKIEKILIDMGAKSVVKEYNSSKKLSGITFCIDVAGNTIAFKMPAQAEKVFAVLWRSVKNTHRVSKERYMEQAERTAWKNVAEWVHIQSSLIMMEQVEFVQVFLPYALNPVSGKTIYDSFKENPNKLLN